MAKCFRAAFSASIKGLQSTLPQIQARPFKPIHNAQLCFRQPFSVFASQGKTQLQTTSTLKSAGVKCTACLQSESRRGIQTEGDKELSKFLEKEINFEEGSESKSKKQASGVDGFELKTDEADITLTRKSGDETIVVKFNVNATVDSEGPPSTNEQEDVEMVSKPPFLVEVTKGDGRTLSMQCGFVSPDEMAEQDGPQDAEAIVDSFEIQEVALHTGDWKDTVYSVSADIMDGNLYDLLMDMLDERGINEEFASQLMEFSTSYEHSSYLKFLKGLKDFAESK